MLTQALIATYAVCIGFVLAGLIGSFFQLVTDRPPNFDFGARSSLAFVWGMVMCILAGPFIIMRQAIRGRRIERRPIGWLVASSTIAGMWSLFSGILILNLIFVALT
ncbi:hypothetical protein C8N35_102367 [Breoghania corrubedonensis]|uniref:Uncharacterized protein n=1 Tax=Breoghania corrubedonensis TaxID=665038 RepID=A0A2T5VD37_9HYPH|nr:hypothetical protein [Breoghania corrubedonensis]PTW61652.1 hypothetical protein C8N35_102367 [Breoghania corrubedonensis]